MKSIDGNKNTAIPYLEAMNHQSIKDYKRQSGSGSIKKAKEHQIIKENEDKMADGVLFKYKIMKIRAKISFMAFKKGITILELFLDTIMDS